MKSASGMEFGFSSIRCNVPGGGDWIGGGIGPTSRETSGKACREKLGRSARPQVLVPDFGGKCGESTHDAPPTCYHWCRCERASHGLGANFCHIIDAVRLPFVGAVTDR